MGCVVGLDGLQGLLIVAVDPTSPFLTILSDHGRQGIYDP